MEHLNALLNEIESLKFRDIRVYESRGKSIFADHFIVATAESTIQMDAARHKLMESMKKHGIHLKNPMEGWHGGWCLLDFGNIIVHLFMEESRRFYDLDSLFESYNFDPRDMVEAPAKKTGRKAAGKTAAKGKKAKKKAPAGKAKTGKTAVRKKSASGKKASVKKKRGK